MMVTGRRAIGVTIAAIALVTTVSACQGATGPAASTPTASTPPGSNPLKSLTSYQIIDRAFANTQAAVNVQITGKVIRAGQATRLSFLALVNGGSGCIGDSIYQSGVGTFQLIDDGTTAWVLPNPDFWTYAGAKYSSVQPAVEGKYLQVTPGASGLGALTGLCSLQALVGTGPSPARRTGLGAPTPATVGGLPAVKISDTADGGFITVSDTAQPQILRFYVPGSDGGSFSFAYSATPVTVAAPPAAEVVDGSQYGL